MNNHEIRERAYDKAYANTHQAWRNLVKTTKEIKNEDYGGVTKEEMELIEEGHLNDYSVWNYIIDLIIKDKNK